MKAIVGKKYRHFKGGEYIVVEIGYDTEIDGRKLVVYKSLYDSKVWIRPYEMFISKVDKEKYPDVKQIYRFEEVKENDKK